MTPHTAARAHRNLTLLTACMVAALGALVGAAAGGWVIAVLVALVAGGGALLGGYLVRHRAIAETTAAEANGAARGYADGLSHGMLAAVAKYEAAVFPMSVGGVTADERFARRTAAYQLASEDELPRPVRAAAADALAALDERDLRGSQDAVNRLFSAVHRQTAGR
jgi:hypothetical protein